MEFDWIDTPFRPDRLKPHEIEGSFEDPFALKLLPDGDYTSSEARYFNLGHSLSNRGVFSVFWTDGKKYRVVSARDMTAEEEAFYERKHVDFL